MGKTLLGKVSLLVRTQIQGVLSAGSFKEINGRDAVSTAHTTKEPAVVLDRGLEPDLTKDLVQEKESGGQVAPHNAEDDLILRRARLAKPE